MRDYSEKNTTIDMFITTRLKIQKEGRKFDEKIPKMLQAYILALEE